MSNPASSKQKSYGKSLEKRLKLRLSPWDSFNTYQAHMRIEQLKLFIKYGVDPNSINWKQDLANATGRAC